ncbi:MAG: FAD-dependent oxidoreductase [Xanthomonadales bacterium]|nr:FAD-dependent oxidoreductase [Xanthomonadales bacterium]
MSAISRLSGDLLIVGAGPAGLSAAAVCIEAGLRVVLVDQQPRPGGQLWRQGIAATWPQSRMRRFQASLNSDALRWLPTHRLVLWRSPAVGLFEGPQGAVEISATHLLLATGARELVPPFPGWTLPGVTGAGALQAMVKTGVDLGGAPVTLAGSGPLLMASAATLATHGARLSGIFETQNRRTMRSLAFSLLAYPPQLLQALRLRLQAARTRYEYGWQLLRAEGTKRLEAVVLRDPRGREQRIRCARLGVSYGLVPNIETAAGLALDQRTDRRFPALAVDANQRCSDHRVFAAGEITGVTGGAVAELEGQIAGCAIIGDRPRLLRLRRRRQRILRFAELLAQSFDCAPEQLPIPDPETVLCRCEDVCWSAAQLGAPDWRSLKLASRVGMGACQGRICGAILQAYEQPAQRGCRPPIAPVSAATLALLAESPSPPQGPST